MLSDDQKKSTTHTKVPEVEAYAPPSDEEVDGLSSEDDTHVDELVIVTHNEVVV